jgi:prepilin-type N-terminal cleavage/methylation domain-containing protein
MQNKGYTLLEIMIAVTIMVLLSGILFGVFVSLNNRQSLDSNTEMVKSVLERAQSMTLSSEGDTQYGVHLETSQVVLFKGTTYSASDPANIATTLDPRIAMSNIVLNGGGSDVIFNRLTGTTNQFGTTTLSLVASTTTQRKVIVSATGNIQSQ